MLHRQIGILNVYEPNVQGERRDFFALLKAIISDWRIPGSLFTWFRGGGLVGASRLDSFLLSPELFSCYPYLVQCSLPRSLSDHKPIILKEKSLNKIFRPFKWFNYWADDSILVDRIKVLSEVNKGIGINKFLLLTKNLTKERAREVRALKADSVEEISRNIDLLEEKLLSDPCNSHLQQEISSSKANMWAVTRKVEREWLQKSRLKWFKEGDKNTKFFHLTAVLRGRKNQISKLKFQNVIFKNQASIKRVFVNYFFAGYNEVKTIPLNKFDIPLKRINYVSRRFLESPFLEEEV
ncbi:uncharacterized protein LOC120142355 [Hibiscus syriacus]|uniref:uncharacterized protein LOC120142355 n=1 Tax=Hibiscus syriacus TaxID=106335 RepID=UPI0019237CD8|nr:uncharacterized protein LOC120142355 [Hibiscus syriacus]